jgi:outer membrane protein FlgP
MKLKIVMAFSGMLALTACASRAPVVVSEPQVETVAPIKLAAVGYGATNSVEGHTVGQKRLLAMRASRLDAYRTLAEQVYGVRLTGNTTVAALMNQNDSFRVYIDSFLRGARVVSVNPMADGNYETTVEIDFDERAARTYLPSAPAQRNVRVPAYVVNAPVRTPAYVVDTPRGGVGPGRMYGTSFYYAAE